MNKVVFWDTLTEPLAWANTRLVTGRRSRGRAGDEEREVRTPMRTMGSLSLCRSLLKAGLVDRFRVVVFPVITGSTGQERIYDGYPDVALEMISSRTFDGRIQLLEYVPKVLAGPPGAAVPDARRRHRRCSDSAEYKQGRAAGKPMSLSPQFEFFSISLDGFGTGDVRASTHRSATPANGCTSGCSSPGGGTRTSASPAAPPASTTPSCGCTIPASAPRSWVPGNSVRPDGTRTRSGRAGGATTRRSTRRPSS